MERETHNINVQGESQEAHIAEQRWKAQLQNRIIQFDALLFIIIIGFIATAMPEYDEIQLHHKYIWAVCGISIISVSISLLVLFVVIFVGCRGDFHRCALTVIIFVAGLSLAVVFGSLLFLVKGMNAIIAILIPVQKLVIVGMIAYKGTRTFPPGAHDIVYDEAYESEMDCSFNLSKLSNPPAFAVQTTLILAYIRSSSLLRDRPSRDDLAITYFALMLCLCSLMITCMPLRFRLSSMKEYLLATAKVLNHAMLGALAWMATTLAAEFLDVFVILSFTPLIIAFAFFVFREFQYQDREAQGENFFLDLIKDFFIGSIAVGYYKILVLVYAKYAGEEIHSLPIKLCMFLLIAAIMSGLALTPFTLKPKSHVFLFVVAGCFAGLLALIISIMTAYAVFMYLFY